MKKVRFLKASYFVWMVVWAGLLAGYLAWGLPHIIFSYDWLDNGHGYLGDFSQRHFTRCTYIGPLGSFTIYPDNGDCGWFIWRKDSAEDR